MVRFTVHPVQRSTQPTLQCEVEILEERRVRSSNGHVAMRPVIETTMEVLGTSCPIEVTLASRDQMGFRMLLGRHALRRRFDVSTGRSFLSRDPGPLRRRVKKRKRKAKTSTKAKTQRKP